MHSITNGALLFSASVVISILGCSIASTRKSKLRINVVQKQVDSINEVVIEKERIPSTTISAPGKALVAGGYLVLEQPNIGVTISSTSRFYSTVQLQRALQDAKESSSKYQLTIHVESPQFDSSFEYKYDIHFDSLVSAGSVSNIFVEKCLSMVLSYTKEALGYSALSDIIASVAQQGKLRSRKESLLPSSLGKLPRFNICPKDENGNTEVVKTGMGSSAALATSLVGALLQWFGVIRLGHRAGEEDRRILHNLAQVAHAVAQGKIGSGFDVAAAVYGTQAYRRFAPEGLTSCLSKPTPRELFLAVNNSSLWGQTSECFSLPPSMDLLMGDVCGGSSSVSMAKEVLKWRREKPEESNLIWAQLADVNIKIHATFQELSAIAQDNPTGYADSIARASESIGAQWGRQRLTQSPQKTETTGVIVTLSGLKKLFSKMRELMRLMGTAAGVEIEPIHQTLLADKTEGLPGVLCAGVPGAGGNDAIFAIILSPKARSRVEDMWSQWGSEGKGTGTATGSVVCPLLLKAEGGIRSGVRPEFDLEWD